jgi:hypothetical protein
MKKFLTSVLFFFVCILTINASSINPATSGTNTKSINAKLVMLPIGNGKFMSLADFVTLTPKKFREITGKRLSLINKLSLKFSQRAIKKDINSDGTIDNSKLLKYSDGEGFRLHGGGFVLGLLLGVIGFLITLLFNDDNRKRRMISSLIGWGVWIIIFLIAIA